ncbi:rhomboid family intramembrane serine protease [Glycomyces terrestris]|uniref:Rhomboid family intramembrane serine protease n=1 Tax=Glycomyces terrestris TaxID=2493553 RepID=A0A426UVV4_9ACTN|nr:rhomboid family intramembrane serine protease [Glycomyces terrestris]RRR98338.1 rhomboid family intramembrane serine protease [Glycomyces terrestris]
MTLPAPPHRPPHPLRRALTLWGALIALLWAVLAADLLHPAHLIAWGITPRTLDGLLPGILIAPFLHADAAHLAANTVPLTVMGVICALRDRAGMWTALAVSLLASGLGVWLTSPAHSVTVGASGVVFGLFGYLLARGLFMRKLGDFLIALLIVLVYGSLIWGVLPTSPFVSWQAHLFGFLGGIAAAVLVARSRRAKAAE